MDKIAAYIEKIVQILQKHATFQPIGEWAEYENQVVIDKDSLHFQLLRVGWKDVERIHHCVVHIDIKDHKIWIQEDRTEEGVANELMRSGIPKEDIVLAFQAPYRRADTGFATA